MRTLALTAIVALACSFAEAQTLPATTFEVASVKPNTRADGSRGIVVDPGRFTATGVPLADLIRYAYGFNALASQSQVVDGPSWMATARFDIVSTSTGEPPLATNFDRRARRGSCGTPQSRLAVLARAEIHLYLGGIAHTKFAASFVSPLPL